MKDQVLKTKKDQTFDQRILYVYRSGVCICVWKSTVQQSLFKKHLFNFFVFWGSPERVAYMLHFYTEFGVWGVKHTNYFWKTLILGYFSYSGGPQESRGKGVLGEVWIFQTWPSVHHLESSYILVTFLYSVSGIGMTETWATAIHSQCLGGCGS